MDYNYATTSNAATTQAADPMLVLFAMLICLVVVVFLYIAMWKLYVKAGRPGWEALIPVYNSIVMLKIAGRPMWWIVLMLIPFVNFVVSVIMTIDFVKSYGKSTGFGIATIFFPIITFPMMAFSNSVQYIGPAGPEKTQSL